MIRSKEEKKTFIVVVIALITMILEVSIGWHSKSMALFADGIHQGAHVLILGLSLAAYWLVRRIEKRQNDNYDGDKILALSAYTSGILLIFMAIFIITEAIERLSSPHVHILYMQALGIACIGLVVNSSCAWILHSKHGEGDLNSHAAYLHVLADALTSIGAIFGLICAMIWGITWIDTIIAVISSLIVLRWAVGLLRTVCRQLVKKEK